MLAEQLPVDRLSFYTLIQGICSSSTPTIFALFVDFLAWPLSHALAMRARTELKTKTKTTTLPSNNNNNNNKKQQQQLRKYKHAAQLKKMRKFSQFHDRFFLLLLFFLSLLERPAKYLPNNFYYNKIHEVYMKRTEIALFSHFFWLFLAFFSTTATIVHINCVYDE